MLQEYWASTVIYIGIFSQCTRTSWVLTRTTSGRTIAALTRLIVTCHPNSSGTHPNDWGNARVRDFRLHEYIRND